MRPRIITSVKKNVNGHCVEFTIGNQTFKTVTFLSKISEDQAENYRIELISALDGLIGKSVTIDEKTSAEKSLRKYIDENAKISPNSTASSIVHKWMDQLVGYHNESDNTIVIVKDGILFIKDIICTFETREIRSEIEGMIELNEYYFLLPDKFTYETILPNGYKVVRIKLK